MLPDNTKERRLAESIIDRYVRGILIKYIEKGYIDSQVNRIGGRVKTSDGNDVTYNISVTGETGKKRYIIKYLLPDIDADRTRSLSDNGEMFMRLIKPVLSHLEETIENLPAIDWVSNSLNKEIVSQLIDHLNNPPDKLFYSLATSSSGENPLIKRLKPSKGQIVNYKIALKAYVNYPGLKSQACKCPG